MDFIIAIIAIGYLIISGNGLVKMIIKKDMQLSIFGMLPVSLAAGLGMLAVLSNCIMLAGLKMSFVTLYVPLFIFFVYSLGHLNIKVKFDMNSIMKWMRTLTWLEWFLLAVTLFGAISVFLMAVAFPLHFWDSRSNWATKAKMLFYRGTIFSSDFTDTSRIQANFRYPLLYPIAQSFIYFSLGHVNDWAVMVLIGLFFPMMVSLLFDLGRVYMKDREKALAASAMLAVLPVFFMTDGTCYSGYCDTPLAMLYLAAFGVTLLWTRNRENGILFLSAFLSAILFLTKNEGINLMALNMMLIVMSDTVKPFKAYFIRTLRSIATFILIALFVIIPWLLLARNLGMEPGGTTDIFQIFKIELWMNYSGLPLIIAYTLKAFIGIQKNMLGQGFLWAGLWLIFIFTAILSLVRRFAEGSKISLVILFNILITSLAYFVVPNISNEYITSNFFRLYQSISPIVILQIVATWKYLESKLEIRK